MNQTAICYHECGHAVMAEVLGGRSELLTIAPEQDDDLPEHSGAFTVRWPVRQFSEAEIAVREIKVALAGPIAEMVYEGTAEDPQFLEEWRIDWMQAMARAERFLPKSKPAHEHLAHTFFEVREFFQRDAVWAAISALADALEAHETLEWEQIDEVLRAWPIGGFVSS